MNTAVRSIFILGVVVLSGCFGRTEVDEHPTQEAEPITRVQPTPLQTPVTASFEEKAVTIPENAQLAPIVSGLTLAQSATIPTDLSHIYTGHIKVSSGKMIVVLNSGQGSEFISVDPESLSPHLKTTLNPKALGLPGELSWQLSAVAIHPETEDVFLSGSSARMEGSKLKGSNYFAMMNGMIPKTLKSYGGNSLIGVGSGENVVLSGMNFRTGDKGVQLLDVFATFHSPGRTNRSFWVVLDPRTADVRWRYELQNSSPVLPLINMTQNKNESFALGRELMKFKIHAKTGKVDIERISISGLPSNGVVNRGYVYDAGTAIGVGTVPVNKSQSDLTLMRFEMNAGQAKTGVVRSQMDFCGRTILDVDFDSANARVVTLSMKDKGAETPEVMIHEFKIKAQ